MGELTFFLDLQVKQTKNCTFLCQEKYAREITKKFGMVNCKKTKTLMSYSIKLDKNEKGKSVDKKLYRSMIDSLLC